MFHKGAGGRAERPAGPDEAGARKAIMSTMLALLVVWSIVALVFYCCYRLWYWTPMPTTRVCELPEEAAGNERRAA
jgi:hypothetical protein